MLLPELTFRVLPAWKMMLPGAGCQTVIDGGDMARQGFEPVVDGNARIEVSAHTVDMDGDVLFGAQLLQVTQELGKHDEVSSNG